MKKIDTHTLCDILEKAQSRIINITDSDIIIDELLNIDMGIRSFYFKNCQISGHRLDFFIENETEITNLAGSIKSFQSISFEDCKISADIFIKDCILNSISLHDVEITSNYFHITTATVKNISIKGKSDYPNIINSLIINNITCENSRLYFSLNNISYLNIKDSSFDKVFINGNQIERLFIDNFNCLISFEFWKNKLNEVSKIEKATINEFIGRNSIYGSELKFEQVIFKDVCRLEQIPKTNNSTLIFKECSFEKSIYFDNSSLYLLSINATFFKDIVSFNSMKVDRIVLKSVHFDKVAFFNDFKILSENLTDVGTIRIIKNQLYKTENKIDYLKYNVIEQNLLLKDKSLNINDKILLKLNKWSNNFGSSWVRALWFTIIVSLIGFFALLLVNTFLNDSDYKYEINYNSKWSSLQEILKEWLRFTFSFDLRSYHSYESNGFLLFVFFFFKIFIGYGVYQTIAAFRKHSK
ncbi:hypothetical protein J2799_003889 [Chryseobacterium vietnamense]|uniref:hypothetical protein n=1 Tax=Chryseobacterium vietnamense TaxID=866785 RepID=UPI00286245DE|nr:hypothetical protein [Chryseobacterium vietnamense]MDR6489350.1 hypothetical protein [Chryseobacterium vietnamense]